MNAKTPLRPVQPTEEIRTAQPAYRWSLTSGAMLGWQTPSGEPRRSAPHHLSLRPRLTFPAVPSVQASSLNNWASGYAGEKHRGRSEQLEGEEELCCRAATTGPGGRKSRAAQKQLRPPQWIRAPWVFTHLRPCVPEKPPTLELGRTALVWGGRGEQR